MLFAYFQYSSNVTFNVSLSISLRCRTKIKKGYTGQDVTLTLPGSLTFNDVDWFAVYCITYEENFGDVRIPKNLNLPAA